MGGFFSGYVLVKKLGKVKFKQTPVFYVKIIIMRVLRILPSYAAALFFYYQFFKIVGDGPFNAH